MTCKKTDGPSRQSAGSDNPRRLLTVAPLATLVPGSGISFEQARNSDGFAGTRMGLADILSEALAILEEEDYHDVEGVTDRSSQVQGGATSVERQ